MGEAARVDVGNLLADLLLQLQLLLKKHKSANKQGKEEEEKEAVSRQESAGVTTAQCYANQRFINRSRNDGDGNRKWLACTFVPACTRNQAVLLDGSTPAVCQ